MVKLISIYPEAKLKKEIEWISKEEGRSMNQEIIFIVKKYIKKFKDGDN